MGKGLAVKMVFWVIIFLIVCIVAAYLMMDIYKQAGNVSIWGQDVRNIKEEEDAEIRISEVKSLEISNKEISDYLTTTPSGISFKVSFNVKIPEGSQIKTDDSVKIEIRGHDSGEDYTPCTFTISGLKPNDDFTIDSSTKCPLALKAGWTGRVSVNVFASKDGRLLTSGFDTFDARLGLSSLASTPAALCSLIQSYIDDWEKDDVSMVNDWDTLTLKTKDTGDLVCFQTDNMKTTLVINDIECPDAVLKCTGVGFYLNSRTVPRMDSGDVVNVKKGESMSIYNTIGKESDLSETLTSVRLTFLDTTG